MHKMISVENNKFWNAVFSIFGRFNMYNRKRHPSYLIGLTQDIKMLWYPYVELCASYPYCKTTNFHMPFIWVILQVKMKHKKLNGKKIFGNCRDIFLFLHPTKIAMSI